MRKYGQVSPRFWIGTTGRQIRALGPDAQVLALYLMTAPTATMTGLYYLPVTVAAHETGIPFEGASKALRSLCRVGFCLYDEVDEVVFIPEMARHQIDEALKPGDKRVQGVANALEPYVKHRFCAMFLAKYGGAFNLPESLYEGPPEGDGSLFQAPSEALRSQEQEQEQEQEKESAPSARVLPLVFPGDVKGDVQGAGDVPLHGQTGGVDGGGARGRGQARKGARKAAAATPEQRDVAARVIAELARVSGFSYEPTAATNVAKVVEQLGAGRSEADLLAVVRDRAKDWRGEEKTRRWLRPETLFGPKFETYLAQARASGAGPAETQADGELEAARRRAAERSRGMPAFDEPLAGGNR